MIDITTADKIIAGIILVVIAIYMYFWNHPGDGK